MSQYINFKLLEYQMQGAMIELTFTWIKRHSFIALFILATALRLFLLGSAPLWYDETGAAWMSSLPINQLIAATAGDVHPPLFFIILKAVFAMFGPNPIAMRLPSVLFGLAALPLTKAIADHIGLSKPASLFAVALMAISPFELWYSQEARMYALLQLCVLGFVYAGLTRRWAWFIAASVAAMYTQNFGLIYYAAFALILIGRELMKPIFTVTFYQLFTCLLIPIILFSPWVFVIISQLKNYAADWIPQVTLGGFLQPLIEYWWPQAMTNGWYLGTALGGLLLTVFAVWQVMIAPDRRGVFLIVMLFAPMAAAAAFSLAWKPMYISRPFIAGAPFAFMLIGLAITQTSRRTWIALTVLPLVALNTVAYYPASVQSKTSALAATDVMQVIRSNWMPGDIIYHGNVGTMLPVWPLTYNTDEPQYLMPVVGWSAGMLRESTRRAMGMQEIPLQELDWRRAWLVWSAGPTIDPLEDAAIQDLLDRYPNQRFITVDTGYAVFGLWLLENDPIDISRAKGN